VVKRLTARGDADLFNGAAGVDNEGLGGGRFPCMVEKKGGRGIEGAS
jgi:hypothetical protein